MCTLGAFTLDHCLERIEPLLRFHHIRVVGSLLGQAVELGRHVANLLVRAAMIAADLNCELRFTRNSSSFFCFFE
jgi:hypothetical protein